MKNKQVTRKFTLEETIQASLLCKKTRVKERSCYDYRKALEKQVLPYYKNLHPEKPLNKIQILDFRHSHVSLLINDGLDSQTVVERLGHSRDMVKRVYSHLFPEKKRNVLNILDKYDVTKK